jgi:hypothetical protein
VTGLPYQIQTASFTHLLSSCGFSYLCGFVELPLQNGRDIEIQPNEIFLVLINLCPLILLCYFDSSQTVWKKRGAHDLNPRKLLKR